MTNEERQVEEALEAKRQERLEMGVCPECEPSVWLRETDEGHICPQCGKTYNILNNKTMTKAICIVVAYFSKDSDIAEIQRLQGGWYRSIENLKECCWGIDKVISLEKHFKNINSKKKTPSKYIAYFFISQW